MSETQVADWRARAESVEAKLAETLEHLAALQDASWDILSALEGGNVDQIAKAKRRLGLVFLDIS